MAGRESPDGQREVFPKASECQRPTVAAEVVRGLGAVFFGAAQGLRERQVRDFVDPAPDHTRRGDIVETDQSAC